jgi:hypothetical protein
MTPRTPPAWAATWLFMAGGIAGCDVPTDPPKLDQEWILPISETSVGVAELLPDEVALTEDSSAFTVQVEELVFQEILGELCTGCAGLDGLTVPKPAFTGDFFESVSLPDDVESVQVQEGVVEVVAENRFSFDPLRPPGGDRGSFTLALRDGGPGGPILDQIVVDGADASFAPGTSLTRELAYSGPVGSSLTVTVSIDSPAGGPEPGNWVLVELEDEVLVTATPEAIEASSAEIRVSGEELDLGVTALNVGNVSQDLVDRIQSGGFRLEIQNPWSLGAILTVAVSAPDLSEPIVAISQVPGTPSSIVDVEFTRQELQSFLGLEGVVLSGQAAVDQSAGTVTLSPDQVMTIDTRLDLVLLIG